MSYVDAALAPMRKTGQIKLHKTQAFEGMRKAGQLVAECLDSGMKIFDPIGWRTERGRLLLVARKGHEQSFAAGKDGIFEKNPPSGQQLYLKKQ